MATRTDESYEIEAQSKGWRVIETLVEERFITERDLIKKLGFKRDLVMRTLRTARLNGYAVRDEKTRKWSPGPRLVRLALDLR